MKITNASRILPSVTVIVATVLAVVLTTLVGNRPAGASAEGGPQFDELVVTVLPEYDQPRVLVIMRGELPSDTPMPLKAQVRVPADAKVTNTCSVKVANQEQVCTQATSQPDGDYKIVSYDLSTPVLYVEYYYGSFSGAGPRTADLKFWPPFTAASLEIAVPAPTDATDFSSSPAPTRTANDNGAKHYIFDFPNVGPDAAVNVALSYSRPTDKPWAPPKISSTSAPADPNDDGGLPQDAILFLALAAALSVAFIGYNVLGRRVGFNIGLAGASEATNVGDRPHAMFCPNCGTSSRRATGYCSACGRELRAAPRNQS